MPQDLIHFDYVPTREYSLEEREKVAEWVDKNINVSRLRYAKALVEILEFHDHDVDVIADLKSKIKSEKEKHKNV